ncbi:unnamed protein product [Rotaria sp. Silwood2]|nr:unnamed protein product [Rotaria sp. Silwood2]
MNQSESTSPTSSEPMLDRYIKLYLLTTTAIPSILTSIYILYKFVIDHQFRSHLNNHSIIAMIIVSFVDTTTELPITLQYLRVGYVQPDKKEFCLFWVWYVFTLETVNVSLMTWTSIERHILIFHSHWIQTQRGKIIWHYIPLIFCITYIPIFYFACVVLYPCENFFEYSLFLCGSICYTSVTWLATFDWTTNVLIPSLSIPFASTSLLFRVLFQAKKMKRTLKWRSTRKLTLQLMAISILYLLFWCPLALVSIIRLYFIPTFISEIYYYYLYYTPYFVQLLMPFVSLACLPEIWPKKRRIANASLFTQNRAQTRF